MTVRLPANLKVSYSGGSMSRPGSINMSNKGGVYTGNIKPRFRGGYIRS